MSRVRGKHTKPEMLVRRLVHSLGYRYRLYSRKLPGQPDMVFASRKKTIFVHGCFWHRHDERNCPLTRWPKSRLDFWKPKLEQNKQRDIENQKKLIELGWKVLIIWECQTKDKEVLAKRIVDFLEDKI